RTITAGFNLKLPVKEKQIERAVKTLRNARKAFEKKGYTVQTTRMVTQPWEQYFKSKKQILRTVKQLDALTIKHGIDEFSIGTTYKPKNMPLLYYIIKNTSRVFCTTFASDEKKINYKAARESAKLMRKLARLTPNGFENLKFAALFNVKPGCPFYPAAYHKGQDSITIGTESSDLVYKAFSKAKNIERAQSVLEKTLNIEYSKLERIAKQVAKREGVRYGGIDVSIATSVKKSESVAYAFEKLGLGKFGEAGTLAIAKIVTDVLGKMKTKKCGYCGLMLPVLEDYGLAKRNDQGLYNVSNLLLYSAVCGTGLDTIPLPGNISEKKLYAMVLDVASLSIKLNKPLSARLMPVPNKKSGQRTSFKFEYFENSKIMSI
ncbi:MAG: DUF711 family protein, partial [Candidatus Aenigmatarchaeota archaeon]